LYNLIFCATYFILRSIAFLIKFSNVINIDIDIDIFITLLTIKEGFE